MRGTAARAEVRVRRAVAAARSILLMTAIRFWYRQRLLGTGITHEEGPMAAKPMSKSQVTKYFAEKFEMPRKQAAAILEEVATLAVAQTKKVGVFVIPGVGKLVKARRKARIGRNPATGESIKIPAKTVVKMRLSKSCKDSVLTSRAGRRPYRGPRAPRGLRTPRAPL